jgi:hypothetical protein
MNEWLAYLLQYINKEPTTALLILLSVFLVQLLTVCGLIIAVTTLARRQARLLRGTDGESLESALQQQMETTQETRAQIEQAYQLAEANTTALQNCLQRIGFIRYDAFQDVGGEQSFSVALLDAADNGVVLSGIHSRNDIRVYAKLLVAGDSTVQLTAEERAAISKADHPTRLEAGTSSREFTTRGKRGRL